MRVFLTHFRQVGEVARNDHLLRLEEPRRHFLASHASAIGIVKRAMWIVGIDHEIEGLVCLPAAGEELLSEAMIFRRTATSAEFRIVVGVIPFERRIRSGVTHLAKNAGEITRLLESAEHRREGLGQLVETKQPAVMTIASRGNDAAARTTNGVVDKAMPKAKALRSERAQVRRDARHLALEEIHGLIAEVIGGDEQDVERPLGGVERGQRQ